MVYRYVPILRFKAGERAALQNLSAAGRLDVAPLVLLAPEQFVGKAATAKALAVPSPMVFVQRMHAAWGVAPYFLDATGLPSSSSGHPLGAIAALARAQGHTMMPATTLSASTAYQAAVANVVATDGRGVALRIDLATLANSAAWTPNWRYPPAETDLIIDLGSTITAASALGAALDPSFHSLVNPTQWRSVTLAGSSMPDNFTGLAAGLFPIPRVELALWSRLNSVGLPYRLDFGDYGTVSLSPPPSGIKWGYPISVKYTLGPTFLICRGVRTTGLGAVDMDVQLRGHATSIVGYTGRGALAYCWGDSRVNQIAAGTIGPSNLGVWVGYSVNRHIETTRSNLP